MFHVSEYIHQYRELVVSSLPGGYIKRVFGVGPQEIVIVGLLVLVIFGPSSLPKMARDLGRFVSEARRAVDDFKDELTAEHDDDDDDDTYPKRRKRR